MAPSQLRLFGEPPSRGRGVGPAQPAPEAHAIAAAQPKEVRLGTSSWSFPGWKDIVYDREASESQLSRSGLHAYASHPLLRAVGVDRTYYAPVSAAALAGYAGQVGDDFRFVVKAPSLCTSPLIQEGGRAIGPNESFLDPAFALDQAVAPFVEGLRAKGGALVFQFPPQGPKITRDAEAFAGRLAAFLGALPAGPPYAVEIRDRKLFGTSYLQALAAASAVHCIGVHPRMPAVDVQWAALRQGAPVLTVVRWMLGAGLGYEEARTRYAPFSRLVDEDLKTRASIAALCREEGLLGHTVLVIVNNKAEGSAPLSVFRLAERIGSPE